jgi:hypothetical protein
MSTAPAFKFPRGSETTDVTKPCLEWLQLHGIYAWRQNTGAVKFKGDSGKDRFVKFGKAGISDILGILPGGRFLAIETKRADGNVTVEQSEFLANIANRGGVALVARSVEDMVTGLRLSGYAK